MRPDPKVAPLLGEHFVLHSSWCTMVPAGHAGGGFHRDASGPSLFDRLGRPPPWAVASFRRALLLFVWIITNEIK
jgi:hypothetical protein